MKNKKIRMILKIIIICTVVMLKFGILVFATENEEESQIFTTIMEGKEMVVSRFFFRNCWDFVNAS